MICGLCGVDLSSRARRGVCPRPEIRNCQQRVFENKRDRLDRDVASGDKLARYVKRLTRILAAGPSAL